jgi:hypothetical protein
MSSFTADAKDAELRDLRRERDRLSAENRRLERLVGLVGPRALPDEAPRSPLFGGLVRELRLRRSTPTSGQ